MANEQNLKSNSERTPKERKDLARKAGKKSGEARRAKKTMREMLEMLLEKQIENPGEKGKKQTTLEAISVSLIQKALQGNVKAFEVLRDTIGQKPIEKVEVNNSELVKQGLNKINEYFTDNKG